MASALNPHQPFVDRTAHPGDPAPAPPPLPAPAPVPPPPPRKCAVCMDHDVPFVKPCRSCNADYCRECLLEMFEAAIDEPTRFPPRCCCFIQLYTVMPQFDRVEEYNTRLEEWLTTNKTYCPSARCSAFIPSRLVPLVSDGPPTQIPLHDRLATLLQQVNSSQYARFFRGDMDITALPGFTDVVTNPIHLGDIQQKIESRSYSSVSELSHDIALIAENAKLYNGQDHPVAKAAKELFAFFIETIAGGVPDTAPNPPVLELFPCPACHISICTTCHQIEHRGTPCDTSGQDSELAMLKQYGYKKCPRCGHGVRRMFGCPHMQCACGAHWCWWCLKSMDNCTGDCGPAEGSEDDDMDEDEDEDVEVHSELLDDDGDGDEDGSGDGDSGFVEGPRPASDPSVNATAADANTGQERQDPPIVPTNLDAGGARRWEDGVFDFGDEPQEERVAQIWSCDHYWRAFHAAQDGFDHGNMAYLECNRCFKFLKPAPPHQEPARRRSKGGRAQKDEDHAWECDECRLIVCVECKGKYGAAADRTDL